MTVSGRSAPDIAALIGPWRLDPARTVATVHTKAMWLVPVTGVIKAVGGEGRVHPDGTMTGTVTFDAESLCTGNAKRDRRMRSVEFLDTDTYPTMILHAARATLGGTRQLQVEGEFAAHGVSRPLTVPARLDLTAAQAVVSAAFELDRGDWGVTSTARGSALIIGVHVLAHFDKEFAPQGTSWTHL